MELLLLRSRASDVVVETLAVGTDRVEQRNALRAITHRVPNELDRIAGLVAGSSPTLTPHDVDGAALDVPCPDGLRIDAGTGLDIDDEVHVRVLPLPFGHGAGVL